MTADDAHHAFRRPEAASLLSLRTIGPAVHATLLTNAISSVEVATIRDTLLDVVEQAPETIRHLVLDLDAVTFVNSEAIGMFVAVRSAAGQRDVELVLAAVAPAINELLVATHMHTVLTVCRTQAELDRVLTGKA